jgi:hypothetical protein
MLADMPDEVQYRERPVERPILEPMLRRFRDDVGPGFLQKAVCVVVSLEDSGVGLKRSGCRPVA